MAYDAAHDQLIASVSGADGPSMQALDPVTLATRWTLPAPALASRIGISDDGSVAYLGLPGAGAVWQVDLDNRVAVRNIQVASNQGEGPLSLSVRPGHPGTVAIAIGRIDLPLQNFQRAVVYDDGVMRPMSTGADGDFLTPNTLAELTFTDADHVVGYDTQTTACTLTRLALQSQGLQPILRVDSPDIYGECWGDGLTSSGGRLITSYGTEVDPTTLAFVRRWPGDFTEFRGGGFLDLATGTWVSVNASLIADQNRMLEPRALIEEFESQRYTLRRSLLTQEPFRLSDGAITDRMATSGNRIAFVLLDIGNGNVVVHSLDLSTAPARGHAPFTATAASGAGVSGVSIEMPAVAIAPDPARNRLVAILDAGIGPDGNSLAVVNPDTGAVEKLIALSDRPADIKVSTTGSIAYVSHIGLLSTIDRVDLVTGQVTTLPLRADSFVIKEDDPQSVAVLDYYQNYTLTAVRDMSVIGSPISLRAVTGQTQLSMLVSNGPGTLFALQGADVARFSWGDDGLVYEGAGSLVATAVPSGVDLESGFGMLWNMSGALDLTTGATSTFPGNDISAIVAPTSPTSAVLVGQSNSTYAFTWLEAPSPQGGNWVSAFEMPLTDSSLPIQQAVGPRRVVAMNENQVALRMVWMDEIRTSAEPSRIYIVKREPSAH